MNRRVRLIKGGCCWALIALCCFGLALSMAMARYPGGHELDPTSTGHNFWRNYLCDLLEVRAINGSPNAALSLARFGLGAFLGVIGPLWLLLATLLEEHSWQRRWLICLGFVSLVAMPGIAMRMTDWGHALVIVVAFGPALGALVLGVQGLGARFGRTTNVLGIGMLCCAFATFALYSHQLHTGVATGILPIVQRLTMIALLLWCLDVIQIAWRNAGGLVTANTTTRGPPARDPRPCIRGKHVNQ